MPWHFHCVGRWQTLSPSMLPSAHVNTGLVGEKKFVCCPRNPVWKEQLDNHPEVLLADILGCAGTTSQLHVLVLFLSIFHIFLMHSAAWMCYRATQAAEARLLDIPWPQISVKEKASEWQQALTIFLRSSQLAQQINASWCHWMPQESSVVDVKHGTDGSDGKITLNLCSLRGIQGVVSYGIFTFCTSLPNLETHGQCV